MIGYLFTRFAQLGWRLPVIIIVSALVRGSYHLYQGFGGFVGNLIMGVDLRPDLPALEAGRRRWSSPTPCSTSPPSSATPWSRPTSAGCEPWLA